MHEIEGTFCFCLSFCRNVCSRHTICHVCLFLVVLVSVLTFGSWVTEQTKCVMSADILGRQAILVQACRENARLFSRAVANTKCNKYLLRTEPFRYEALVNSNINMLSREQIFA